MIKNIVWVKCQDKNSADFFTQLYAVGDYVFLGDDNIDSLLQPSFFQSEKVALAAFSDVSAKSLAAWVKSADSTSADVVLVIPYNKDPLKAAKSYPLVVVDANAQSVDSVCNLVEKAGFSISKKAARKIASAKEKSSSLLCKLLSQVDGEITYDDVVDNFPFPEEKFYLISDAIFGKNTKKVESLFSSFSEYKVPWEAVSAFVQKQVTIAVACINAGSFQQKKLVAQNMGVSPKSLGFFMKKLPDWDADQCSVAMWAIANMDTQVKSGKATTNSGAVKANIRFLTRI